MMMRKNVNRFHCLQIDIEMTAQAWKQQATSLIEVKIISLSGLHKNLSFFVALMRGS